MFLIDLQVEVSSNFSLFCLFSQNLARLLSGFMFISCPLVIVLYLESSENNLFELDFSISRKRVSTVKPSQDDDFLSARL